MLNSSDIWILFAIYMIFLLVIAFFVNRKNKKNEGNLLTAKVSAPVLIMTYVASLMSTWVFFAGPGAYYRGGMGYWISELSYICLFPIVAYFTMNKVWLINQERKFITPADFYCARWNSKALRIILGIIFILSAFPYIASVLIAIARAAMIATGNEIDYTTAVIVVGLIMTIFVTLGGTESAAIADTIQGILFIGFLWVIAIATFKIGFNSSFGDMINSIKTSTPEFFSYPGPEGWVTYISRFGYPFSCAIGWTVMLPHVFVRSGYFGDNLSTQRKLTYIAPILQAIVWTGTFLIGMVGIGLAPGLSKADTELIIPYLINNFVLNSNGTLSLILMVGFFIGATAVGLSTANGFLSVSSSIVQSDFIDKTFGIKINKKNEKIISRVVIAVLGLLSTILAINPPDLIFTLIMFSIAIVMPLFPILIFAIYWKKGTKEAAIISSIFGSIVVLLTYFVWGVGDTWYGALGMIASTATFVLVSFITKARHSDIETQKSFFESLRRSTNKFFINTDNIK